MKRMAAGASGRMRAGATLSLVVVLVPAFLGLVLALAACATEKQGAYATAPASIEPNGPISWAEARSRLGERLTAEGPVASVQEAGGEVLLDLGADAPDPSRLVVIIPASIRDKFPKDAVMAYQNGLVRATGLIEDRDGVATIVVTRPADLATGL